MKYRNLGKSGLKISELSYGSWVTFSFQIDTSMAVEMMKIAYDKGVNFFDNAEAYANGCLLYTSPSPRDRQKSRMPSSA